MYEYMKLVSRNGSKQKIAEGSWEQIKSSQEIPHGMDMELIQYNRGQRCKVAAGPWDAILEKMEGTATGFKSIVEADAIPHLVLGFGLLAWSVLMTTIWPYIGAV